MTPEENEARLIKKREYGRRRYWENAEASRAKLRLRDFAALSKRDRVSRAKRPYLRSAHEAVSWAIKSGKMVRQPCEVCGSPKAVAHHDDYSRKLEVRWLCPVHHKEFHRNQRIALPPLGWRAPVVRREHENQRHCGACGAYCGVESVECCRCGSALISGATPAQDALAASQESTEGA